MKTRDTSLTQVGVKAFEFVVLTRKTLELAETLLGGAQMLKGVVCFSKPSQLDISVSTAIESLNQLVVVKNPHFKNGAITQNALQLLKDRADSGLICKGQGSPWNFSLRLMVPESASLTREEQVEFLKAKSFATMASPEQLALAYLIAVIKSPEVKDPLNGLWARVNEPRLAALTMQATSRGLYFRPDFCDSYATNAVIAPAVAL